MDNPCQLCLSDIPVDIEVNNHERYVSLSLMLDIFKLPEEFQFPRSVCSTCYDQLEECFAFHQQIIRTDDIKRSSIMQPKSDRNESNQTESLICVCDHCGLRCKTIGDLRSHQELVHSSSRHFHRCDNCNKYFKTNRGLQQHSISCLSSNTTRVACAQCQRDFTTRTAYLNHLKYHMDYLCYFCDHAWNSEKNLLEHVQMTHKDRLFHCKKCTRTERSRKGLNRHLRTVHDITGRQFYCGHCSNDTTFESSSSVIQHVQETHKDVGSTDGVYSELLSDNLFSKDVGLVDLESHCDKLKHEENQEVFLMHFNLVRTATSHSPYSHKKMTVNPNKMILEEFLDEAFENDQIWTKYIEGGEEYLIDNYEFYLDGPAPLKSCKYKCPRCEEGFSKQCMMTIHLAEVHKIACLICNDCGASFNRLTEYKSHRQEHLKDNVRFRENIIPEAEEALSLVQQADKEYLISESGKSYSFECKLCHRSFAKKCNFQKHKCSFKQRYQGQTREASHHQSLHDTPANQSSALIDSLFCTLCDKTFSSISGLKYHLKRHTDIKAFSCLYCSRKFTANSNLNAHIRNVHSEVKCRVCPECDMRFASKDHLSKHIRSKHREKRSFVCPECPKSYFQKSHLNDHLNSCHVEYKAFNCRSCSKSYSCKGSLRRHMTKAH